MGTAEEFNAYRGKMNEKIMTSDSLILRRIFNPDTSACAEGHLNIRPKELIGLTYPIDLRCDDGVRYHLGKCRELGLQQKKLTKHPVWPRGLEAPSLYPIYAGHLNSGRN